MSDNKSPLAEAEEICNTKRAETHGSFKDNFERTARIFTAWTGRPFTAREVTQVLQALKMAREEAKPEERDNFTDQAGYLYLRWKLSSGEQFVPWDTVLVMNQPSPKEPDRTLTVPSVTADETPSIEIIQKHIASFEAKNDGVSPEKILLPHEYTRIFASVMGRAFPAIDGIPVEFLPPVPGAFTEVSKLPF